MHKISSRSTDSEGSACNIRTWYGKTSEDGQAESEHGSMEASEELEIRSKSIEVLMVSRSEALEGQKTRRCSCHTQIFDPPEMTYLQDFHQDKTSTQSSHSSIWYLIEDAQRQESSGKGSINTKISL